MSERFAHLHVHSDMSLLAGCATMEQYIDVAVERGHPGIAFTEYGTMRGMSEFMGLAKKLKPVYGIEFYVCGDMSRRGLTPEDKATITDGLPRSRWKAAIQQYEQEQGIHDRLLLTVWARTNEGLANLFKLVSRSWNEGFYYKPRIDLKALIECGAGLMVGTGCPDSAIHHPARNGRRKRALEVADTIWEAFGPERTWLEIMPHALYNQALANQFTLDLRKRWGKGARLLATQDAHYVHEGDHKYQRMLAAIGERDRPLDECGLPGEGWWMKTRDEMAASFAKHHSMLSEKQVKRALDNTVRFVESVETTLGADRFQCIMPEVYVAPESDGEYDYLKALCRNGWTWRKIPDRAAEYAKAHDMTVAEATKVYIDRLTRELKALKKQNFVSYILYVRELYEWVRSQDIACGPGRGSAAGSIVNYLIGITSVDPVEHGLLFERFISPQRIDMPDVDCDFEDIRRGEIIQHLKDKYGHDNAAQIATIGKLKGKACLRDISRVLKIPISVIGPVTKALLERSSGDERASMTIEDSFKEIGVCREFNEKHPEVLEYARHLEGLSKTLGIHAAGVVCAPKPLEQILPLESREHDGKRIPVTAVDFWGAEGFGLLKLDVLGLRTMTVLRMAADEVRRRHDVEIDYENLPLNDPKVLQGFTDHDYSGIFQYDSPGADKICSGVNFSHFEDVAAMTALNRPGTARSGLAGQYVARKKDPKLVAKASYHPAVSKITADTLGIIVYQEHVIKIFTEIAGFEPGTADSLRKKIAKKMGDETLGKEREKFIEGAMKRTGMSKKQAGKIMDAITFFGSYGFNKTVSYGTFVLRAGTHSSQGTPWITIGELAEYKDQRDEHGRLTPIAQKFRYQGIRIIQMDEDGRCRPGKVVDVHDHGVQQVYQIETEDGHLTPEISKSHRLMTSQGYASIASGLGPGDELIFMGEMEHRAYCQWWNRPETMRGRATDAYRATVDQVWASSNGRCQDCGKSGERRRGGHEVAHIKTPAECDYNETAFHSLANLKLLCNGCHKKMDCANGQRTKRWRKGRPTYASKIKAIHKRGKQQCYDLEMDTPGHNYVATPDPERHPPVVSHNSHATAYGMIAYWGMYVKTYYPLEFFKALLYCEPNLGRIQSIAKDAKAHGIEVLPADVSVSGEGFTIDDELEAIRGSLSDIKGVGKAAAGSIMATQPFSSFWDFMERVERRKVNKRVVHALALAGALDNLLPNTRWFVENMDTIWELKDKKGKLEGLKSLIERSSSLPDYDPEERSLVAARVSPLAFGKHPIDAYSDFIEQHVKVPLVPMGQDDFWELYDSKTVAGFWICGIIIEIRMNQVGDFHSGEHPSDDEKKRMKWGAQYANVNIEGADGKQNRVKFDWDIFETYRHIVIDRGKGTPVIVHVTGNKRYENLRAHLVVDLEQLRKDIQAEAPLELWPRVVAGRHPSLEYKFKNDNLKALANRSIHKIRRRASRAAAKAGRGEIIMFRVVGVITHVREKLDKKMNLMGFFGLLGQDGYIDALCFGSMWPQVRKAIQPGRLVEIELEYNGGQGIYSGDILRWLK